MIVFDNKKTWVLSIRTLHIFLLIFNDVFEVYIIAYCLPSNDSSITLLSLDDVALAAAGRSIFELICSSLRIQVECSKTWRSKIVCDSNCLSHTGHWRIFIPDIPFSIDEQLVESEIIVSIVSLLVITCSVDVEDNKLNSVLDGFGSYNESDVGSKFDEISSTNVSKSAESKAFNGQLVIGHISVVCWLTHIERWVRKIFKSVKFVWHLPQMNKSSELVVSKVVIILCLFKKTQHVHSTHSYLE